MLTTDIEIELVSAQEVYQFGNYMPLRLRRDSEFFNKPAGF